MKRVLALLLVFLMIFALAACGTGTDTVEPTDKAEATDTPTDAAETTPDIAGAKIEVAVGYIDTQLETFQTIIDAFTAETGVEVELITPGADYEAQLKTMMGSNALPDVWMTHGWSLLRYSEYLQVVNDQPWFDSMDESVGGVMADADGNYYALCLSMIVSGIEYNKDTLDAAGVDPYAITTWEDFEAACDKVLEAGFTPIVIGGSSSSNFAGLLGSLAPTFWTDAGAKYDMASALQGGTFDFDTYATELYEYIATWIGKDYFNKDVMTLDNTGAQQMLGSGDAAFMMRAIGNITTAKQYFPDANLGIIPLPTSATGAPSFRIGEGDSFGVWKDTESPEACWALLAFLARPENVKTICEMTGNVPAIPGVELTDSYAYDCYLSAQTAYGSNVQYDNIFDRKYFPSGMWSIMGDSVSMLFDNPSDISGSVTYLKDNYAELYAAANS